MIHPPPPHLRLSVLLSSFILLTSSFSCAPLAQPRLHGLTPTEAEAVAILAVRTAERSPNLDLEPFDTQPTPAGQYHVSVQRKTSSTTADHWKVLVHPNRSAEVLRPEPPPTSPDTLRAYPAPLRGDTRLLNPVEPPRPPHFPSDR